MSFHPGPRRRHQVNQREAAQLAIEWRTNQEERGHIWAWLDDVFAQELRVLELSVEQLKE